MKVTLSWFEVFQGVQSGGMRRIEAMKHTRQPIYGEPNLDLWGLDIEAALAEIAVAKAYDLYWEGVARAPSQLRGDVSNLQVRSTYREDGCLILHEDDPDDALFVLVTGRAPTYTIRGWMKAAEGKSPKWWREGDGRPAFFVPQTALNRSSPVGEGRLLTGPWPASKSTTKVTSSL